MNKRAGCLHLTLLLLLNGLLGVIRAVALLTTASANIPGEVAVTVRLAECLVP